MNSGKVFILTLLLLTVLAEGQPAPQKDNPTQNPKNAGNPESPNPPQKSPQKGPEKSPIIKDHSKNPKNQQSQTEEENKNIRTFPIHGNVTLGYFYVDLYVGINAQRQSVILDSGSSLTTFPCKGIFALKMLRMQELWEKALQ